MIVVLFFIDDDNQRLICLCLLYHLSMDDRTKAYFTYTKCNQQVNLFDLIIELILNFEFYFS